MEALELWWKGFFNKVHLSAQENEMKSKPFLGPQKQKIQRAPLLTDSFILLFLRSEDLVFVGR